MWKPVTDLSVADLRETPVWEWCEQDGNEMVRPSPLRKLSEYRGGPVHIAATAFVLANGQRREGYCSPAEPSGLDYTQPVILTAAGAVALWREQPTSNEQLAQYARWLGAVPSDIFPVTVQCLVPVDGTYYHDTVRAL